MAADSDAFRRAALPPAPLAAADLDRIERQLDYGMTLQALPSLAALRSDPSVRARLLAGRLLNHGGAQRSGDALIYRTWRAAPYDARAMVAALRTLGYRHGPRVVWSLSRERALPADTGATARAEWWSLQAYVWGQLRHFTRAEAMYRRAVEADPDEPWVRIEWAYVCEAADRYDEALAIVREVLRERPGYRSAVQAAAHFMTLVGRDDEALALLADAVARCENSTLTMQLLDLQFEHGLYAQAAQTLERCVAVHPLAETDSKMEFARWFAARRCDLALRLGDVECAREWATQAGGALYGALAQRLAADPRVPRRVLLPVPFVRQHNVTCAPATLSALSHYWRRPAEHLTIAEKICYDGTPWHSERRWAEEQGYLAREFTVDWDNARALIDAGVPFTLTTTATASGHLQAVIGYDEGVKSLLVRDPFMRTHLEFDADALFGTHRTTGPRGLALLTPEAAARVAGLALRDEAQWDGYTAVMAALDRHDRAAALQAGSRLAQAAPGHRLALWAQRALALYDGDEAALLAATEQLLAQFPDDTFLRLSKASSLGLTAPRARQLVWLRETIEITTRPRTDRRDPNDARAARVWPPDPAAMVRYAALLADDGRELTQAATWLRRALALAPVDAAAWNNLGHVHWREGRRGLATEHYEVAACLQDMNEDFAVTYFRACNVRGEVDTGLAFLRDRAARLGDRSGAPAMTLFQQLEAVERAPEGIAALEAALVRRPDDAGLAQFLADAYWRVSRPADARAQLERVAGPARESNWLRLRARLARDDGDLEAALTHARGAAAQEPFYLENHRLIASLLAQQHGRRAAVDYLRGLCARFDHHGPLHELITQWMSDDPPAEAEPLLRHLVGVQDTNAWAWRELAGNLSRQQRHEEALAAARKAVEIAPESSWSLSTLAFVQLRAGRHDEGREWLRRALALSIDNDYALERLVATCATLAERGQALEFIRTEAERQVSIGDAWLSLQGAAATTLAPEDLLAMLRAARGARPDLWQTWVALIVQLSDMSRPHEALAEAGAAIEKFPLLPRVYLEQARAHVLLGDREAARASLAAALRLNPFWPLAVRRYVETIIDDGVELERAFAKLDPALARDGENSDLRALRAWIYGRLGRVDEAIADLTLALKHDPRPRWIWSGLARHAGDGARPALMEEAIAAVTAFRPADAWAWLRASEFTAAIDGALQRVDRALELDPRNTAAWEVKLERLVRAGRFDDADRALALVPWGNAAPAEIRVYKARLARARGDKRDAVNLLEGLLAEDPNQYGLWSERADWADQDEAFSDYQRAAREMVRLAPNGAVAHGWLGDAALKCGDRALARESFARSLALDPAYTFAANHLFDLHWKAEEFDTAARVLAQAVRHTNNAFVAAREVQVAAHLGERERAVAALRALLPDVRAGDWPADTAIAAMNKARWFDIVVDEIERAFGAGECAAAACRFWLAHQGHGLRPDGFMRDVSRALQVDPKGSLKRELLEYLLRARDARLLNRFIRRFDHDFRADPELWGQVGYALLNLGRHDRVAGWMRDWRRDDAPVWALDNLALALRVRARDRDAHVVSQCVLERAPDSADARVWMLLDAAGAFDIATVERDLAAFARGPQDRLQPYLSALLRLVEFWLEAARTGDAGVAAVGYAELRGERDNHAVLRRWMRRLGFALAMRCAPPRQKPWRLLQLCL
jgi:tetratricopeptide (TPR) repeat protein